jgi:stearoyl-CoA desaturase (delta-9 desaturase)
MIGDRRFRTHDDSANNWFVALFAFGEGLQNNHHAFPSSYRHAMRWWEPDISGLCLYLLSKLGLVWGLKVPSQAAITRAQL